ncbi:hypothetical protein MPH47_16205 [Psychrobacillus psychrodurans]|uniref:hypothetical protein n=1 Tax=Psychrobacillus psychrodurans TaxID=126157 RepID=UPI001F4D5A83|nr:hypothetical protein [Psychrobacillus psychrodurans]MCK1998745.1 hypothetical protein [Psychrobacillus psychrodurans]
MKLSISLFVTLPFLLMITSCSHSNYIEQDESKKENFIDIEEEKVLLIDDSEEEFSYLSDLSEEELQSYELFTREYDTNYLKGFSPEKTILIYIHSAVIGDIEAIYSLAYFDGELPGYDSFKEKYYENLNISNLEIALDFRYYDSIKIKQEDSNGLLVELMVNYGRLTATTLMGLKKENETWKIEVPDLLQN